MHEQNGEYEIVHITYLIQFFLYRGEEETNKILFFFCTKKANMYETTTTWSGEEWRGEKQ